MKNKHHSMFSIHSSKRIQKGRIATASLALAMAVALAAFAGNQSASAATQTWSGNTTADWNAVDGFGTVPSNGDLLVFGAAGTAGTTLNNNIGGFQVGASTGNTDGISFNSGAPAYTINGNGFTIGAYWSSTTVSIVNNSVNNQSFGTAFNLNGSVYAKFQALSGNLTFNGSLGGGNSNFCYEISGPGTVYFTNTANTYAAETLISSGVLNVASLSDYDAAGSLGNRVASTDVNWPWVMGIRIEGGTLQYTGSTPQSTNRMMRLGANATIDASGTDAGTVSFTAATSTNIDGTIGWKNFNLTGTNTGNNTMATLIGDGNRDNNASLFSVIKNGVGTWVLTSAASSYRGNLQVNAGVLSVTNLNNYGSNGALGNVLASEDGYGGIMHLILGDGSTLRYTGTGAQSTDRMPRLGNNTTFEASGATSADTMSFTAHVQNNIAMSVGPRNITLAGANPGDNTFAADLLDNAGSSNLIKSGTGTWVYSGNNSIAAVAADSAAKGSPSDRTTSSGTFAVNQGILKITGDNSLRTGANTVAAGATIVLQNVNALGTGGLKAAAGSTIVLQADANAAFAGVTGAEAFALRPYGEGGSMVQNFAVDSLTSGSNNTFSFGAGVTTLTSGSYGTDVTYNVTSNANNTLALGTIHVNNNSAVIFNPTTGNLSIEGLANGSTGGITKNGAGTLTISGIITSTGNTTVTNGTLSLGNGTANSALADPSTVTIAAGAKMNLNFSSGNSDTVNALYLGSPAVLVPAGTYNSSTPTYGSYFTGAGSLVVTTGSTPVSAYDTWAVTGYGLQNPWLGSDPALNGEPTADPDHDGMTNEQEFAFGLIPNNGSSVNPIVVPLNKTAGTFSYQRLASSGLVYKILTSTDLANWSEDTGAGQSASGTDGNGNQTVTVTLSASKPLAATTLFVRVSAAP